MGAFEFVIYMTIILAIAVIIVHIIDWLKGA